MPPWEPGLLRALLLAAGIPASQVDAWVQALAEGWLPFEVGLLLRGPSHLGSLDELRRTHLAEALGCICVGWQEPVRRLLASLATGQGCMPVREACLTLGRPEAEGLAMCRLLVRLRVARGTWRGGEAHLELPRPFTEPLLSVLGPEYVEARMVRQSLAADMLLAQRQPVRLRGARLAFLRDLASEGILGGEERLFVQEQVEGLAREEASVQRAYDDYRRAEEELAKVKQALAELPAPGALATDDAYRLAAELSTSLARRHEACTRAWQDALVAGHRLLVEDPGNPVASQCVAALHWDAMRSAESQAHWEAASHHRNLAVLYGGAPYRGRVRVGASILVESKPKATVKLWRLQPEEGVLRCQGQPLTACTPCAWDGLESGPILLEFHAPGYAQARVALNAVTDAQERVFVQLYRALWVGEDMVHIPAGVFTFGGDPKAPGAGPARQVMVPDFFMARFPVTFRQYCQFLDALGQDVEEVLLPRDEDGTPLVMRTSQGTYLPIPSHLHLDGATRYRGNFALEVPVVGVCWEAANAFCQWISQRESRAYRLPSEVEWEKAAKGGQARAYPWGDGFHPRLCKMRHSRPGVPGLEPVGVFAEDVSPHLVHDMAGGVSEWCRDLDVELLGLRVVRGGSWLSQADGCRVCARQAIPETSRSQWVGFRVCMDPAEG